MTDSAIQTDKHSNRYSEEYLNKLSLWQFGDWETLLGTSLDNLSVEEYRSVQAYKLVALMQLGRMFEAKRLLKDLPTPHGKLLKRAFRSSLLNTLGKAWASQGEKNHAEKYFISSLDVVSDIRPPIQVYKTRIEEQVSQLSLDGQNIFDTEEVYDNPSSIEVKNSKELSFNQSLTISFWLNIYAWPEEWTNVVAKFKSDSENEFCLRIKNGELGQFYCGQGGKPIVLNTWRPSDFINIGHWAHVTIVKKHGKFCRLYVDGIIRSERDISGLDPATLVDTGVEFLGNAMARRHLNGSMYSFVLFDEAIESKEVRSLMLNAIPSNQYRTTVTKYTELNNLSPMDYMELERASILRYRSAERIRSLDYHELVHALPSATPVIVVVGANDGRHNDPIYEYLKHTKKKTSVLLVEPQAQLLPYLEQNYSFHPKVKIVNAAVGDDGCLSIYCVKPEYWQRLNVSYAVERGWPTYRAPTGVASSSKQHVQDWLKKHSALDDVNDAIERLEVPSSNLRAIMKGVNMGPEIDVLQVDTEGFDDYVIYQSCIEEARPKIIYFEVDHLDRCRTNKLYRHLESMGYEMYHAGENTIALSIAANQL